MAPLSNQSILGAPANDEPFNPAIDPATGTPVPADHPSVQGNRDQAVDADGDLVDGETDEVDVKSDGDAAPQEFPGQPEVPETAKPLETQPATGDSGVVPVTTDDGNQA